MEERELKRYSSKKKLGVFVVVLVVLVILGLAFYYTASPEDPPANRVVAAAPLSEKQREALAVRLSELLPSGAPEPEVVVYDPAEEETAAALREEIENGDGSLYLMTEPVYGLLGGEELFSDLSERYAGSGRVEKGCLYAVGGTSFLPQELAELPPLYLAIRQENRQVKLNNGTLRMHAIQWKMLDEIVREK